MQSAIKTIIRNSNVSKTALAKELKISRKTFYNWLEGKTEPISRAHIDIIKRVDKKYTGKNIEGNS